MMSSDEGHAAEEAAYQRDYPVTPYRSPMGWHKPTLFQRDDGTIEVQVSFPNEDPDTEDDLTLNVQFTGEGIIIDLFVSDGEPVATFCQTYEEFGDTMYDIGNTLAFDEEG